MNLLTYVVPWWGRLLAILALAAAVAGYGFIKGENHVQALWDAEKAAQAAQAQKILIRQGQVVEKVVTKYQDRVKIIKEKADEVYREVEKFVPQDCPAPGSERVLLQSAIDGTTPRAADVPAADPIAAPALAAWQLEVIRRYQLNAVALSACWDFYDGVRQARGELK